VRKCMCVCVSLILIFIVDNNINRLSGYGKTLLEKLMMGPKVFDIPSFTPQLTAMRSRFLGYQV
jgi:hypothetical protein